MEWAFRWQIELMFKGFKSIRIKTSEIETSAVNLFIKIRELKSMPNSSPYSSNKTVMLSAGYRHIHHSFIKTARYIAGFMRGIIKL